MEAWEKQSYTRQVYLEVKTVCIENRESSMRSLADIPFLCKSHENLRVHTRVHVDALYIGPSNQPSPGVPKLLKLKQKKWRSENVSDSTYWNHNSAHLRLPPGSATMLYCDIILLCGPDFRSQVDSQTPSSHLPWNLSRTSVSESETRPYKVSQWAVDGGKAVDDENVIKALF